MDFTRRVKKKYNEEIVSIARSFAWWGRDCYCVGAQNKLQILENFHYKSK